MTESFISYDKDGNARSFVGPDAVALFAAVALRSAIDLYLNTGMKASRFHTPTNMLLTASRTTGKQYKRGKAGLALAAADLNFWIDAMKAAIPHEEA